MKEAGRRGLDVGKLHASHTPAWANLRDRRSRKERSYYEGGAEEEEEEEEDDEVADPLSEGEEVGARVGF